MTSAFQNLSICKTCKSNRRFVNVHRKAGVYLFHRGRSFYVDKDLWKCTFVT